MPAFVLFVY